MLVLAPENVLEGIAWVCIIGAVYMLEYDWRVRISLGVAAQNIKQTDYITTPHCSVTNTRIHHLICYT